MFLTYVFFDFATWSKKKKKKKKKRSATEIHLELLDILFLCLMICIVSTGEASPFLATAARILPRLHEHQLFRVKK